jgi:hypothetical protein
MKGRRLTVYLSGPMDGCTDEEMFGWRHKVRSDLGAYYEFIDPTRRDYRKDKTRDDRKLADRVTTKDKIDLLNSDIVLCNISTDVWKGGMGTPQEMMYAFMHSRHVVVVSDRKLNSYWTISHSHSILKSLDDAIEYLKIYRFNE